MKSDVRPAEGRDLSRLRSVGSTGSPLSADGFRWVYEHVGSDTWLFSTSGGTDVVSAFVGTPPTLPVYEGELQGRAVVGEVGELVLTEPLPSMPVFFWGDPDGERYRDSYFSVYPGIEGSGSVRTSSPTSPTTARPSSSQAWIAAPSARPCSSPS